MTKSKDIFWTEERKQRTADYISGFVFGYGIGLIAGYWWL